MDKAEMRRRFLTEHPEYASVPLSRLPLHVAREKRMQKKADLIYKIAVLRFKNDATLERISEITGLSVDNLSKKIRRYIK